MNALIKSATVIDPKSKFHNETVDICIEKGKISAISKSISNPNNYKEIKLEHLHVSQGWFDSSVSFGQPGYEDRETIANGLNTAAASGFTDVALNPNTNPILDTNADISFVKNLSVGHSVKLHPIGALTKNSNGIDLAELYDMHNAGAIAFYDYQKPITNPNLMKIALQYASNFDGLVCSFPIEPNISGLGVMHEGKTSTLLGLKGIPSFAEELQIARDLSILEYTNGKLHIPNISTTKSVDLIRTAKSRGLNVSCSVAIHNLILTDTLLSEFDTNYKVLPPLREQQDCEALIKGLLDGTIDMVTSDHNPIDIEHKRIEFDHAMYGCIGLESAFGALLKIVSLPHCIDILTRGKERFGITKHTINIGETANLTLFNPNENYTFTEENILSSSKNSCFLEQPLQGKVYGVVANNKITLNA